MSELQCVGVLVCGSCGVWELRGTNTNNKKDMFSTSTNSKRRCVLTVWMR